MSDFSDERFKKLAGLLKEQSEGEARRPARSTSRKKVPAHIQARWDKRAEERNSEDLDEQIKVRVPDNKAETALYLADIAQKLSDDLKSYSNLLSGGQWPERLDELKLEISNAIETLRLAHEDNDY